MPSSQRSFESRANRFSTANDLIQVNADYNSNNVYTTKAALGVFVTDINNANTLVATTLQSLNDLRTFRRNMGFKIIGPDKEVMNPLCMEMRIEAVAAYLKSDFGEDSGAYKAVHRILKKIRPRYPKKDPNAPRGAGISPMEKSFLALVGQAEAVIAIITALGIDYNPSNANLSLANVTTLTNDLRTANSNVTIALRDYGDANRSRKKIFDSKGTPPGMDKRITLIKSYLASFDNGKKSDAYIEFVQAIKGT